MNRKDEDPAPTDRQTAALVKVTELLDRAIAMLENHDPGLRAFILNRVGPWDDAFTASILQYVWRRTSSANIPYGELEATLSTILARRQKGDGAPSAT